MAGFFKKTKLKMAVIIALSVVLMLSAVGGVYAYLMSRTDTLSNQFVPATVSCKVVEQFENGVKSNVCVENTGNVSAYIRAVVVVTFKAEDGKVLATAPVEGTNYTVEWGNSGWQKGSDGFWYYTEPVGAGLTTSNLIKTAEALPGAPEGYKLNVQIIASAIQSDPVKAVEEAWGVTTSNGTLIPKKAA